MFWKVKNLNPAQGFEHVKGYAGLAAGKPRGCSEHVLIVLTHTSWRSFIVSSPRLSPFSSWSIWPMQRTFDPGAGIGLPTWVNWVTHRRMNWMIHGWLQIKNIQKCTICGGCSGLKCAMLIFWKRWYSEFIKTQLLGGLFSGGEVDDSPGALKEFHQDTKKLGSKIRTKIAVAKQINHGEVKQLLWRLPRITSHCEIEHKTLENSVPRIQWHMTSIQMATFWALRVR